MRESLLSVQGKIFLLFLFVLGLTVQAKSDSTSMNNSWPIIISPNIKITQVSIDYVEIINMGDEFIDVSNYWFHNGLKAERIGNLSILCGELTLLNNASLTIKSGLLSSANKGELGLFKSNNYKTEDLIDYINWGLSNFSSKHLDAAIALELWNRQVSIPSFQIEESIQWDKTLDFEASWKAGEPDFCKNTKLDCDQLSGGRLTGETVELCIGNGIAKRISKDYWVLANNSGPENHWIITDENKTIIKYSSDVYNIKFEKEQAGNLQVFNLSYIGTLDGLDIGKSLNDLKGCYSLSNPMTLTLQHISQYGLDKEPIYFCVDDGLKDTLSYDSSIFDGIDSNDLTWIITNKEHIVITQPFDLEEFDFEGSGEGQLLLWGVRDNKSIINVRAAEDLFSSLKCPDLIGPLIIYRLKRKECQTTCSEEAGSISFSSDFAFMPFCTSDHLPDNIEIEVQESIGYNSLVLVDSTGTIISLGNNGVINVEGSGIGQAEIYNVAYNPKILKLEEGQNLFELTQCHSISNPLSILRKNCKIECSTPENIQIHKSSDSHIKLSWNAVKHAMFYQVTFGPKSDPNIFIEFITTDTKVRVSDVGGGPFEARIKVQCTVDAHSAYSEVKAFDTTRNN